MTIDSFTVRPISANEWLPDRCLTVEMPFNPNLHPEASGCASLSHCRKLDRESLEQLYQYVINKYGGCGFVAWEGSEVIAYHNFFPAVIANKIRFYGYGNESQPAGDTLVHNCLTIVSGKKYLRCGVSGQLVRASINWARNRQWKRFEVHAVLPDCDSGWGSHQKSCRSFWEQLGFKIFKEQKADREIQAYYGVKMKYSMVLFLAESRNTEVSPK